MWFAELQLLEKFIDVCNKHGLSYQLVGGSLLGAIRHKGFIPWDDDLDIIMTHSNYNRFLKVCKEQLNSNKYYVQEGLVDWPLDYSKIKLRDTILKEPEAIFPQPESKEFLWMCLSWTMCHRIDFLHIGNMFVQRFCYAISCR